MTELQKSFSALFLLEKRARDIYSEIIAEYGEDQELKEKIGFIKEQEVNHMRLAAALVEITRKGALRKRETLISKKELESLKQDFIFKGHLLNVLGQLLSAKLQSFILVNSLAQKNIKFQKTNELRETLTRATAHHFKNPLTVTKWTSDLLLAEKKDELTPYQKEMLGQIQAANKSMFLMVDEILQMASVQEGKKALNKEAVDLARFIKNLVKDFEGLLKAEKQKIELQISPKARMIQSNPEVLKKIISNLLTNAVRYGKQGGKISIKAKNLPKGKVLISVADEGAGIPQKEQKDIFQRFFRASNAKRIYSEGSGLGLYITRELVKTLGGKIWFKSKENKGSEFFLQFPVA